MSVMDRLRYEAGNTRYPVSWTVPAISLTEEINGNYKEYSGFGIVQEHKLTLQIDSIFRCNDVELEAAKEVAYRRIGHVLFAELRAEVDRLTSALMAGDKEECSAILGKMRGLIK